MSLFSALERITQNDHKMATVDWLAMELNASPHDVSFFNRSSNITETNNFSTQMMYFDVT